MNTALLEAKNLDVSIGGRQVLFDVGLSVQRGEAVGIIGETGSGKTMLLRTITGLLPTVGGQVDAGTILLGDRDVTHQPARTRLRQQRGLVSLVPQASMSSLDPLQSIGSQLREALHTSDQDASERAVREALEAVRLAPSQALLKSKPHELSGGMRQRVMIALALASSPQLLLADEPTTALDASVRMSVLKLFTDLRRERNLGLVIVSHDINAIATATDRVLVMNKGRVVETGPTPEVMSDPQDPYTQMLVAALPDRTPAGYYLPVQRAQDADSREDAKRLVPVPRRAAVTDALTTIVADRVNFSYREHQVLFDVSLSVRTGERIGIVGESGSGKSTLARLLTGVLPSPHVAVNDTPWRNVRRQHAERHAVQLILQDPFASLTPSQSALTTVAEAVRAANGATRRAAITQATELLESVGLAGEVIHRKPRELSGGQCQRVSIARALAVEPSILVADEPTSALDLSVQAGIVNLLLELTTQRPLGLVVVSHDLAVLAHLADSLIVMKDGRIVESGPTPQILHDAKHEYTRQLVSANPFLNLESEQDVRAHTGALA